MNTVVAKALADAQFREKFITSQGLEVVAPISGGTPEQFAAYLKVEREMYEKVIRITGVRED